MLSVTQQDRHEVANRYANSPLGSIDPDKQANSLLMLGGYCPSCAGEAGPFEDELSLREYRISGLCQACQDAVFGIDREGPMEVPTEPSRFDY